MSPSWISLWANVILDFISSIIPGFISYSYRELPLTGITWIGGTRLIQPYRSGTHPAHHFVDDWHQIADFAVSLDVNLPDPFQRLIVDTKVLKEDHNCVAVHGLLG